MTGSDELRTGAGAPGFDAAEAGAGALGPDAADRVRQFIDCAEGTCGKRNIRRMTVQHVIEMEWDFFQRVNNAGGRANCQDMPNTFSLMRTAQFSVWTDEMLFSYYDDLRAAQREGRNPLTEKYAYMMESTHPDEFARIKDVLPRVSDQKRALIDAIVAIQITWAEALQAAYPHFARRGRAVHAASDAQGSTSIETYSRGELSTYSVATLELMLRRFRQAHADGVNLQEHVDAYTARGYGYSSLSEAEAALAKADAAGEGAGAAREEAGAAAAEADAAREEADTALSGETATR